MNRYLFIGYVMIAITVACNNSNQKADAYGNFESRETIISSEATGKLLTLTIEEGMQIAKGTFVGTVDTTQVYLTLQQVKAQRDAVSTKLASIDANIDVLTTQKETAETELNRVKKLVENAAATQQQLDQVKGNYDVLINKIKSTQVQKQTVYAELKSLKVKETIVLDQLKKCKVLNPLKGTVLEIYTEENEMVAAGKPIYKIANLDVLDLRVYVSGAQLSGIAIGNTVTVRIDADEEDYKKLQGAVSWIASNAEFTPKIIQTKEERVKLVYAVKVKVINDGSLKIGMPGEVVF